MVAYNSMKQKYQLSIGVNMGNDITKKINFVKNLTDKGHRLQTMA